MPGSVARALPISHFIFWVHRSALSRPSPLKAFLRHHVRLLCRPCRVGRAEAAYIALGLLVGVSADSGVVIPLLRRGRDLAIGIPVIIIWQLYE
ncbi:MAG: hypothetical protein AAYR33_10735 [Acetobacteraceae bacterium]